MFHVKNGAFPPYILLFAPLVCTLFVKYPALLRVPPPTAPNLRPRRACTCSRILYTEKAVSPHEKKRGKKGGGGKKRETFSKVMYAERKKEEEKKKREIEKETKKQDRKKNRNSTRDYSYTDT